MRRSQSKQVAIVKFANYKLVLMALATSLILILAGCGSAGNSSGNSGNAGNPGPSSNSSISFGTLQLAPPPLMSLAQTASFAAFVPSDPGNKGVDWSVTCTPGKNKAAGCGIITGHTASGYPTTYIAPSGDLTANSIPVGGTVTVTAASTADNTKKISTTILITVHPVTVGFSLAPPSSVTAGSLTQVIPAVGNDVYKNGLPMGVDLVLSCGSPGACGSISPTHTDGSSAGNGAIFTAPSAVPPGNTVSLTAVSTADPTQSATATITITQGAVTMQFLQNPVANLPIGASTSANVLVNNDPYNSGVDWTLLCLGTDCGTLSRTHTASGQPTVYTAPAQIPSQLPFGNIVTITAASSINPAVTLQSSVTITPANPKNDLLNGRYAFLLQGVRAGAPWAIAGSFFADGIGNIGSVTERVLGSNDTYTLSGTYYIGSDGRGTITLNGAPGGLGFWFNGQQTFKIAVIDQAHIQIEAFDGYYDPDLHTPFSGTVRGTLEQQTVSGFHPPTSGAYSFALTGMSSQGIPSYYGGVFNGSSYAFYMDRSIAGVVNSVSGSVSFVPAADGSSGTMRVGPYVFGYFVVDSTNWILIGAANANDFGSGHMYQQPSSVSLPKGTYVFAEAGSVPQTQGSQPTGHGGLFTCDSGGNLSGSLDSNLNGTVSTVQVAGTCSVASGGVQSGRGVLTLNSSSRNQYAVYPTASHGLLLMSLDAQSGGTGAAMAQAFTGSATASLLSGNYAAQIQSVGAINVPGGVGSSYDFQGRIHADGVSALTGVVDLDQFDEASHLFWTQTPDATMTGRFTANSSGRFTGSFSIPPLGTAGQILYVVDGNTVLTLGTDKTPSTGILQLQKF